jgi:hypothetical protein
MIAHIFWNPSRAWTASGWPMNGSADHRRVSLCLNSSPDLSVPADDSSELCQDCVAIRAFAFPSKKYIKESR